MRILALLLLLLLLIQQRAAAVAAAPPPPPPPPVVVVSLAPGGARAAPAVGYGGEWIFQTAGDGGLTAAEAAASSQLTRFPGGTPADYFDWATGWLSVPTGPGCGGCDSVPARPTSVAALRAFLAASRQRAVLVVNQLTGTLEHALAGLAAHAAAGTDVALVELGNEMYDATRPDVLAAYPRPQDYALKMANWSAAIKAAFPAARVAWVGLANDWDDRTRAWNGGVFPLAAAADAATIHLYPGLPAVNLSDAGAFPALLAPLFPLLAGYRAYTDASIPARLRLWVTEWGTWGLDAAQGTWLQALWHAAFLAALPAALPRVDVVAPYCAVCGDANMPAFTTDAFGPIVPPNASVPPAAWRRTASGHGYALLLAALRGASAVQALDFAPNAVLDPAVPASRTLVGLRASAAAGAGAGVGGGATLAAALVNLGAAPASLDASAVLPACAAGAACATVYSAASPADAARQGIRVEQLVRTAAPFAGGAPLALPPYAVAVLACECV